MWNRHQKSWISLNLKTHIYKTAVILQMEFTRHEEYDSPCDNNCVTSPVALFKDGKTKTKFGWLNYGKCSTVLLVLNWNWKSHWYHYVIFPTVSYTSSQIGVIPFITREPVELLATKSYRSTQRHATHWASLRDHVTSGVTSPRPADDPPPVLLPQSVTMSLASKRSKHNTSHHQNPLGNIFFSGVDCACVV